MVTRRAFLKTAAGFAMAPMVRLRQEIDAERLMLPFCGDPEETWRYHIGSPFGVGQLTYATDNHAMVRTELANRREEGERRLPPVDRAWAQYWRPDGPWSYLTPDDIRPAELRPDGRLGICPECGNRRKSLGDYFPDMDTYDAWKALEELGYEVETNTIRDTSCPACNGKDFDGPTVARVCGQAFNAFELKRILALPNVRVCKSVEPQGILFQADGFEGVALGLRE